MAMGGVPRLRLRACRPRRPPPSMESSCRWPWGEREPDSSFSASPCIAGARWTFIFTSLPGGKRMKTTIWPRRRPPTRNVVWSGLIAAATGAGLMYFLDPQSGRTRRARARQRTAGEAHRGRAALSTAGRDLAHRTRGLAHAAAEALTAQTVDIEI